jgi:hypothetical protein
VSPDSIIVSPTARLSFNGWPSQSNFDSATVALSRSAVSRALASSAVPEQDPEFIATEPRDAIGPAHAVGKKARGMDQRIVSGLVAVGVVDPLKVVDVDEQQRRLLGSRKRRTDENLQLAHEAAAVWEFDQRIFVRQMVEGPNPLFQGANFGAQTRDFGDQVVAGRRGGYRLAHP